MNEHAGPACALSCLIVGLFAVLLHDKIPPSAVPSSTARSVVTKARPIEKSISDPPAAIHQPIPSPTPESSPKGVEGLPKAPSSAEVRATPSENPPKPNSTIRAESREELPRPSTSKKPSSPSPRPPFAVVEAGETLSDVALRVYGSKDSAQGLWKANRDQVERVESALTRGTLLRTP